MVGINPEVADKLDIFWASLSLEHRAALHTAFNLSMRDRRGNRRGGRKEASELLINAESGHTSVVCVLSNFFTFLEKHVSTCTTGLAMMEAILEWGELPDARAQSRAVPSSNPYI
jgi:hypothetical protein